MQNAASGKRAGTRIEEKAKRGLGVEQQMQQGEQLLLKQRSVILNKEATALVV